MKVIHISCLNGVPDFSVPVYGTFLLGNGIDYNFVHPLWKNKDSVKKAQVLLMEVSNLYFSKIKWLCHEVKKINPDIRIVFHGPLLKHFDDFDFVDGLIIHFNPKEALEVIYGERRKTKNNLEKASWQIGENEIIRRWFSQRFKNPYTLSKDILFLTRNGCPRQCFKCGISKFSYKYGEEFLEYIFWNYYKRFKDSKLIISDVTPEIDLDTIKKFKHYISSQWRWKVFSGKPEKWEKIKEEINLLFISASYSDRNLEEAKKRKLPIKFNVEFQQVNYDKLVKFQEITLKHKNISFEIIHFVDVRSLENESDIFSSNLYILKGNFYNILSRCMSYEKYFNKLLKQISEV